MAKNLPAMQDIRVWSLGWEDVLEKGMATYSSILAWKIPYNYLSVCFLKTRTVSYRELSSILCNGLYGKRINKKARCVCVCTYIHNWFILLYMRNEHNTVNQIYSKKKDSILPNCVQLSLSGPARPRTDTRDRCCRRIKKNKTTK